MKPTWELTCYVEGKSSNCRCLTCEKEFTFLGDGHFNMRLIKCPTCNQEVWVPRCPNGCSSFKEEEADNYLAKDADYEMIGNDAFFLDNVGDK